jgi:hypothetical protein
MAALTSSRQPMIGATSLSARCVCYSEIAQTQLGSLKALERGAVVDDPRDWQQ